MALRVFNGFEAGNLIDVSATSGTISVSAAQKRSGDYSLLVAPTGTNVGHGNIYRPTTTTGANSTAGISDTGYAQAWIFIELAPSSGSEEVFSWISAATTRMIQFRLTSARKLDCYNADGTTLLASGTTVLALNTWYLVEWKAGIETGGGGNGPYELKINGVSEYSGTNGVTGISQPIGIKLGKQTNRSGESITVYYDDVAFDDTAYPSTTIGSSTAKVVRLDAVNDGTDTAWTGSYTDVDDVPNDSDTTYISTSTSGQAETVLLESTTSAGVSGTVHAVMPFAVAREEPSVSSALQLRLRSGASTTDSTSFNHTTTYATQRLVYIADPATSAAWTLSGVDGIEVGVEANAAVEHRCTMLCAMVLFTPSSGTSYLQGVTLGRIDFNGLSTQNIADFRTRLIQSVSRGELKILGGVLGDSLTKGSTNQYIESLAKGQLIFNGLTPGHLTKISVATIEGIDPGILNLIGLSPEDGFSGVALTGKSAASKLGLGNYSSVDIWSTPFGDYIRKFDKAPRPKQEIEVDLSANLAELQLLTLQIQELQDSLQKVTATTSNLKQQIEYKQAVRQQKNIERKIRKLKHESLLAEDEELLILLFT